MCLQALIGWDLTIYGREVEPGFTGEAAGIPAVVPAGAFWSNKSQVAQEKGKIEREGAGFTFWV